jgi:ribosomal protein S18 acetylase RimI-like enzyme
VSIAVSSASASDVDTVLDLLNDAVRWLAERGVRQWEVGQWKRARMLAAIENRETYLARDGERIVGSLNLAETDEVIWPEDDGRALYVHRLVVARDAHGRGVGVAMLRWAEGRARERGCTFLRLDTACDSVALRAYYEAQGYRLRDERIITSPRGDWCSVRYEKAVRDEMTAHR